MEELPEEIFIIILPYLGGIDFTNLRKTCWRIKIVCDKLEMEQRPVLWYRYVMYDFGSLLTEVTALSTQKTDEVTWRQFYIQLSSIRRLRHGASYVDSQLKTGKLFQFKNIGFVGDSCLLVEEPHAWTKLVLYRDLFPYSLVFSEDDFGPSDQPVGLKLYARHELECCLLNKERFETSDKRELVSDFCICDFGKGKFYSKWANKYYILYDLLDQFMEIKNLSHDTVLTLDVGFPKAINQVHFNNNQVVISCEDEIIVFGVDLALSTMKGKKIFQTRGGKIVKSHLQGNLLITLKDDGSLLSAEIVHRERDGVMLTDFRPLDFRPGDAECYGLLHQQITDFCIHHHVFAAISDTGHLYLSIVNSWDHESIERNCLSPYKLQMSKSGSLSHLDMTSHQGLKVVVLEQIRDETSGSSYSQVHMIFVKRSK